MNKTKQLNKVLKIFNETEIIKNKKGLYNLIDLNTFDKDNKHYCNLKDMTEKEILNNSIENFKEYFNTTAGGNRNQWTKEFKIVNEIEKEL